MNAPQERGQDEFVDRQNIIIEGKMIKEGVQSQDLMAFILGNAPLFRFFAEHLPDELASDWANADHDPAARHRLEAAYDDFHARISPFIEEYVAQLDPDAMTELTEAIDDGRIDFVSNLIENWVNLNAKQKDRVEE